ncbi:hypothetical protein [Limnoglobus roseus]|uniref:Uncharacterized protein n=1 Tax=Limnoglobus roseus TaxID=2598579 RepID=A0A5C1AMX4_9BACT|nr:hypothetical protein [Limnoglobus roseus]QEL20769.1 hypothetical protein PX52LOC_07885 [Limnoglobus roseus]
MRFHRRIKRVRAGNRDAGPFTIFLVEAAADRPVGVRVLWGGIAREVCYDPDQGPPPLPPGGPHKLILGPAFDV